MTNCSHRFSQARVKFSWAQRLTNQIFREWKSFLQTDFCQLAVEDKPNGRGQRLRVVSLKPLPLELILTLGDTIHNYRCALDYVVAELLGWKDTRLTFPMAEDSTELANSFRTEPELVEGKTKGKGRNAALELVAPGIGQFIVEEVRPYRKSENLLWELGKLDARDKHRLLLPVYAPQAITGIFARDDRGNRVEDCTGIVTAGGECRVVGMGTNVTIERYNRPTAEIYINETGIIEGARLLPTLEQIARDTSTAIDLIADFSRTDGK